MSLPFTINLSPKAYAFGLLVLGILFVSCTPQKTIPVYFAVPDWTLTNQEGMSFSSSQLKGQVYIANFIFSRCPSVCPKMLKDSEKLQQDLLSLTNVKMLTFTVDPEQDTPPVLKKLSLQYNAKADFWFFLTDSDPVKLFSLYKEGFKVNVSEAQPSKDLFDIAHSEKMVLVDQRGQIRGYYSYNKLNELIDDIKILAKD
jgi:protein SCO1/2